MQNDARATRRLYNQARMKSDHHQGRAIVIISRAVVASLAAALLVSVWEALVVSGGEVGAMRALLPIAALYAIPCLFFGIAAGVFMWSWNRQFGDRALGRGYRELANDRELEAKAVGAVFAAAVIAVVILVVTFVLSMKLVAGVERKSVGAILAAAMVVLALPFAVCAALPAYRLGIAVSPIVPRLGPIVRPAVLVLAAAIVIGLAAIWVVTTKLDWRALPLGPPVVAVVFAALFVATNFSLVRAVPAKPTLIAAGALSLVFIGNLAVSTSPAAEVATAITDNSRGAGVLVRIARSRIDGDGDGVSAFFAGPDCDDTNPRVFPALPRFPTTASMTTASSATGRRPRQAMDMAMQTAGPKPQMLEPRLPRGRRRRSTSCSSSSTHCAPIASASLATSVITPA